jgi:uracil-DNA glycosylase family 4
MQAELDVFFGRMNRRGNRQSAIEMLSREMISCELCPRLRTYCRKIASEKRRQYRDWEYWGKPVPGFGDPDAQLVIIGLAPGAHGSNRTGRMFTGDRSGDFLYRALYEFGFASQPWARDRHDGLRLRNCYITAAVRCAPPGNKPTPEELRNCRPYLERELAILRRKRAVMTLGRVAFDTYLGWAAGRAPLLPRNRFPFQHGASYILPDSLPRLFASYHPSQQNTQTGKLTAPMFRHVLQDIRRFLSSAESNRI